MFQRCHFKVRPSEMRKQVIYTHSWPDEQEVTRHRTSRIYFINWGVSPASGPTSAVSLNASDLTATFFTAGVLTRCMHSLQRGQSFQESKETWSQSTCSFAVLHLKHRSQVLQGWQMAKIKAPIPSAGWCVHALCLLFLCKTFRDSQFYRGPLPISLPTCFKDTICLLYLYASELNLASGPIRLLVMERQSIHFFQVKSHTAIFGNKFAGAIARHGAVHNYRSIPTTLIW